MPDDYSKHLEKRIKEMRERMAKSKLYSTKKRKYWNCRFGGDVWLRNVISNKVR